MPSIIYEASVNIFKEKAVQVLTLLYLFKSDLLIFEVLLSHMPNAHSNVCKFDASDERKLQTSRQIYQYTLKH